MLFAANCGFQVYVYDNSPNLEISNLYFSSIKSNIIYLSSGKNIGLSKSINLICKEACKSNIEALLFFDQDTIFNQDTLYFIDNYFKNNKLTLSKGYSGVLFNGSSPLDNLLHTTELIINSGFLFILTNFKKMGWLNNHLFVDGVDYYFSLLSLINDYKIGEIKNTPGYDHASEQGNYSYKILANIYLIRKYPIKRIFDVIRSNIFILIISLYYFEYKFFLKILKLLVIYLLMQLFVRTLGFFFITKSL